MQPEPIVTATETSWQIEAMAWLETHKLHLAYAGAAGLALWFATFTYQHVRKGKEAEANAALAALNKPADKTGKSAPVAAADYLRVAETHGGTPAAERALLFAADRLFAEGKYSEAKARFEKYLASNTGRAAAPVALMGVAACQEAAGEADKALATYEQLIAQHSGSPEVPQAKLAIALLHEQKGRNDQALRLYDEVLRAKPVTVWRVEAEMRREQLLRKDPKLNLATPAAAVPAVAPGTNAPAKK